MKNSGMNTAISDRVMETMVKPISREPFSAASIGLSPSSRCRTIFSITTTASSTTKPTAIVKAISDRCPDRRGAVRRDGHLDGRRNRGLKLRQQRLDVVDGLDDVGAGYAEDG